MGNPNPAFMIDGAATVDRDDAIRLKTTEDGTRILTVYVADLTAALDADPGLLEAALAKGATIYRRHMAVKPMLPAPVEERHALAAGAERQVLRVRLPIDAHGVVGPAHLSRGVLGNAVALTYWQATSAVRSPRHRFNASLSELRGLAEVLFRARLGSSCAFYDLARGVFLDEDGSLVKVKTSDVVGHLIVQECMIAANRAVAEWAVRHDVPIIFRNHLPAASEPPAAVHLADLAAAVRTDDASVLGTWMARAELTGRRARYEAYPRGHHGLGAAVYTHATSPLRRGADLVTQRAIVAHLERRDAPFTADQISQVCDRLTVVVAEAEALASVAVRERAHAIARRILDEGTDYPSLKAPAFFALVKRASKEDLSSPGFLAEVVRRAEADRLELRDLYHVLLLPSGEAWAGAKAACLGQVARNPGWAASLVAVCVQTRGLDRPEFTFKVGGPSHRRTFTASGRLTAAGQLVAEGAARSGPTKAAAQSAAALSLLASLCGAADPSAGLAPDAPARPTPRPVKPLDPSSGPLGALNHLANLEHIGEVSWSFETTGAPHSPSFHARVTARHAAGGGLEAHGAGTNKRLAKANAAAGLLRQLEAYVTEQPTALTAPVAG